MELALTLCERGATVVAADPGVKELPTELARHFELVLTPEDAIAGAAAVVLATPWPEFRKLDWPTLLATMSSAIILDANWFLADLLRKQPGVAYAAVGLPWASPDERLHD